MSGPSRIVLLPGMDGTGRLLSNFASKLPESSEPNIVSYPTHEVLGYRELELRVLTELPSSEPFLLLGESFSGPLALRVASRKIPNLSGIVLVASFVRSPLLWFPRSLRGIVGSPFFRIRPPAWVLRRCLAGADAPADLMAALDEVRRSVSPVVFAARGREILGVDERVSLRHCGVPVLYLGGRFDRIVRPARTVPELKQVRPDLEVELVDAPHLVLQRRPEESAEIVNRFMQRCAEATIRDCC